MLRLHDRTFEIEIDQMSPKAAGKAERPVWAVVEVPQGPMVAGSFHYTVNFNAGIYKRGASQLPEGWEFSDVPRLNSSSSGCTIVDRESDPAAKPEVPVRPSEDFTEAQMDQALEKLRRISFPASRENIYKAAGLSAGPVERLLTFGGSKTEYQTLHALTAGEDGYKLVLRSAPKEGKGGRK